MGTARSTAVAGGGSCRRSCPRSVETWTLAAARPRSRPATRGALSGSASAALDGLDVRAPPLRPRMLPAHGRVVLALEAPRDRACRAGSDRAEVDLAERDALGGRAADEDLVRGVELVARDRRFDDVEPEVSRERDERVTRDPFEDRGRGRRDERAAPHEEEVLAGALGDVAVRVEEDRLVETEAHRLRLREEAVDVVPRDLRLRQRDVRVVARERRDVRADAVLERLAAEVARPLPRRDADARPAAVDVQVPAARVEEEERPDVALAESVRGDDLKGRVLELALRERKLLEAEAARGVEQPRDVLRQP